VGIQDWERYVDYDKGLTRPAEVDLLCGDASKSKRILGFEAKVKFRELVQIMVGAEMDKLRVTHSDDRRDLTTYPEAKLIEVKRDTVIGQHYHSVKTERFILSSGECDLLLDGRRTPMVIGQLYTVVPGQYHEFHAKQGVVLIGLNSHAYDPADDYRLKVVA
jgi:D-lyxose ketol-isomerase